MNKGIYPFKVGNFECMVISDGTIVMPDVKPKQSPEKYQRIHPGNLMDVMSLLVRTGEHNILFDTGVGVTELPAGGNLLQNLESAGIPCTEIDKVVVSHAHGDHICGIIDAEGKPVFPNARYIMFREEWECWMSDPSLSHLDLDEDTRKMFSAQLQSSLIPVKDRVELIDGDTEIVPGMKLIKAPGHTPGSIVLLLSSGNEQLLGPFDVIHQPSDLARPDLLDVFDMFAEQGSRTRMQILSQFIPANPLVFECHFPFPGLGHIVPKGDGWLWQPIDISG